MHPSLKLGEVTEIRLVKNYKGQSKGFAYVEFKDEVCMNDEQQCVHAQFIESPTKHNLASD